MFFLHIQTKQTCILITTNPQMTENADALLKDPSCQKSKDHFNSSVRVLELVQISEIEMLLETIIGVNIRTLGEKFS